MSSPACGFQDVPVPPDLAPEHLTGLHALSSSGQQRRRLGPLEPRPDRRLQVREHRSTLLPTRRDHRPDPLAPAIPRLAPRPLRDQPVDHHEPDRLLRQVVRRLHSRSRDEPEITRPVRLEPLRQVAAVLRLRHIGRAATQHLGPGRLQLALKDLGG